MFFKSLQCKKKILKTKFMCSAYDNLFLSCGDSQSGGGFDTTVQIFFHLLSVKVFREAAAQFEYLRWLSDLS